MLPARHALSRRGTIRAETAVYSPAMIRPGADPDDVRMADVLCDFCRGPWTLDRPMVEGHRGAVICGHCLTVAYTTLVLERAASPVDFDCLLCREGPRDRAALERAGEPGWTSPAHAEASVCRRCVKRAAGALHKDPDAAWCKPVSPGGRGDGPMQPTAASADEGGESDG